ncbi:MAG: TauD/TfdA dioxygenase family protein [Lautropia sp.]
MIRFETTPARPGISRQLGAVVHGADLSRELSPAAFAELLRGVAEHGLLRIPRQSLDAARLRALSARFGTLERISANGPGEPGMPEVSILSNIVVDGRPIGLPDAGQDWHTDMTYNRTVGFVNVLWAIEVPVRDGRTLGGTEFADTQAAYDELPDELRAALATATARHDFSKFHDHMRANRSSNRPALTEQQRRERPPVDHPVFLRHPITGRRSIYVNPGFTVRINGLPDDQSDRMLHRLFDHVLRPEYRHTHHWQPGDVLIWDHLTTWHFARPDYRPDERRLIKRCQVLADKVFDPAFVAAALNPAAP